MTLPQSQTTTDSSLGRDVLYAARYYLRNRWVLVTLVGIAMAIGLYFGGWGWLVAAGLAPLLLSALPCLIMCGLGYCMMCHANKTQATAARDAESATTSPTTAGLTEMNQPAIGGASCCHGGTPELKTAEVNRVRSVDGKDGSHA